MSTSAQIDIKNGDTLRLACVAQDDAGNPVDLTGWTVTAQVRDAKYNALVASLSITVDAPQEGAFTIEGDTANWPVGDLSFDIRYLDSLGRVAHTETIALNVQRAITEA